MNDLESSARRSHQVIEEEPDGAAPDATPPGIGVYERPERRVSPALLAGLVILFLLLIVAALILFVL